MNPRRLIIVLLALLVLTGAVFAIKSRDQIRAATVRLLYPLRPSATGLVGYWTFDPADISGTTAIDRSGNDSIDQTLKE